MQYWNSMIKLIFAFLIIASCNNEKEQFFSLTEKTYKKWRDYIVPTEQDLAWIRIPWRISFQQGLIDAGSNFAFIDPVILFTWQSKMDKVIERLKIEAAKLGANGVLIMNTDNKIYQSSSIDDKGNAQSSSHTEKFGKAIAIYVIQ